MWDDAPKSVLVIQTAFIGDVVLTIPLLEAIKILWMDAKLDVVVRPPAQNLLETLPYLHRIWAYDKLGRDRSLAKGLGLVARFHAQKYDLALLPHRSWRSGLMAKWAGIPVRVGFDRGGGRHWHTRLVPYPATLHEIDRNLQLLTPFDAIPQVDPPVVLPDENDAAIVSSKLGKGLESLVAMAPGSVWFTKRWPEAYFTALAKKIAAEGFRVALVGGLEDRELGQRIASALGPAGVNLCGELTLRQSVELLRRCSALITNDSAPTHLGAAAGIPVITLFGSTIPEFGFGPYGSLGRSLGVELYCRPCTDHGRQKCPEKHFRCMRELTPERVFESLGQAMAAPRR